MKREDLRRWAASLQSEGRELGDTLALYADAWDSEVERLREVAHAAHHLLCNRHLMCADPDDDGSLAHYMSLLQGALDAARDDANG